MTLRVVFGREDLQRVRFAAQPDPMWELVLSLHKARKCRALERHSVWQTQIRHRLREHDQAARWLAPLFTLVPMKGAFPDFLTPAPLVTDPKAGVAELRRTAADQLRGDLTAAFADHSLPQWVRRLAAGERDQLDNLAEAVGHAHELLLAPYWDEVCDVVRADRADRVWALADGGLDSVLPKIPGVRGWDGTVLEIDYPVARTVRLDGRGLTLLPSYFCAQRPVTFVNPDLPPMLIYPADGHHTAKPVVEDYGSLDALLSRTRAECLSALTTPRTTSALARAVGASIGTASKQATVLRHAGLVDSVRDGTSVRHQITDLGAALLIGRISQSSSVAGWSGPRPSGAREHPAVSVLPEGWPAPE